MQLKVLKLQNNSGKCMICGAQNIFSIGARFYELQKNVLCSIIVGRDEHQSFPNRMHGGMVTGILDEAIGRAILMTEPDVWGVTSSIEVKFRKPVPLNQSIKCFSRITKSSELGFRGVAILEDEFGNLLASAEATYVKKELSEIVNHRDDFVWGKFPEERGLKFIDLQNEDFLEWYTQEKFIN